MAEVMQWTGDPGDENRFAPFLRRADRVGANVIWWMEPGFDGRADVLISHELAEGNPLRVRPGYGLELRGAWFVVHVPGAVRR